jgi:hypothetical protein
MVLFLRELLFWKSASATGWESLRIGAAAHHTNFGQAQVMEVCRKL